MAILIDYYTWN